MIVCGLPELTTLTSFGDISNAPGVGAIIVMVAVVAPPTASSTFRVTVPAVTFAGKVTTTGDPFQIPFPAVVLNPFDGSVEVVI